jgi:uncharacterized protein YkwD
MGSTVAAVLAPARLRLVVLALAGALLVSLGGVVAPEPAAAGINRVEKRFAKKINDARENRGLRPLKLRLGLSDKAASHSRKMARRGYLFHTSDFSTFCCWRSIGENVGYGYSVKSMHRMFMNSTPHRANILDRRWRAVGVGTKVVGNTIWVTVVFRQPR